MTLSIDSTSKIRRISAGILVSGILLFSLACKKDSLSSRQGPSITPVPTTQEYDEYLLVDQTWVADIGGSKFIKILPKYLFWDYRVNTGAYLQREGYTEWMQLPYVSIQDLRLNDNPNFFYTVKLDYSNYLPSTILFVYALRGAPIDFSEKVSISLRRYR
jgi:hypothetical protein